MYCINLSPESDSLLEEYQATHHETAEQIESTQAKLRAAKSEQAFWEQMATEAEQAKVALKKGATWP